MKKMLSAILSLAMVFTMCTTAFAAEEQAADGTFDGYQEIVQSSFSQRSATPATLSNSNDTRLTETLSTIGQDDYIPLNLSPILNNEVYFKIWTLQKFFTR